MDERLIQSEKPNNMLWKLFRIAVEEEEIPEETTYNMTEFIASLRPQEA